LRTTDLPFAADDLLAVADDVPAARPTGRDLRCDEKACGEGYEKDKGKNQGVETAHLDLLAKCFRMYREIL
jgi:hypothetical protein